MCGQLAWAGPVFMVRRGGWLDWVARVGLFVFKPVRTASMCVLRRCKEEEERRC